MIKYSTHLGHININVLKDPSGGIIIYIKNCIAKGVDIVKNTIDCIVWIKLDKYFFNFENDIYLCATYIAPENSPVHNLFDLGIHDQLLDDTLLFKEKGSIFITGDLNSRVGNKSDFIENDIILNDDETFEIDRPLYHATTDPHVNKFGNAMIDMCKATNLRIVNGRLFGDNNVGKCTCVTLNGQSLVDYLLTQQEDFHILDDFCVLNFNEFSNHAPVYFSLKTNYVPRVNCTGEKFISQMGTGIYQCIQR